MSEYKYSVLNGAKEVLCIVATLIILMSFGIFLISGAIWYTEKTFPGVYSCDCENSCPLPEGA